MHTNMASSIASPFYLDDSSMQEGQLRVHIPKQTAIDKVGGIFCHICSTTIGNKKDFDVHYSKHSVGGNVVYTCVVCKKQITGYPSFRDHCYVTHVVKNKFQCKLCTKSFPKLSILNSHIVTVHQFKCSQCNEKFPTKKDLELHKIIHFDKTSKGESGEPPYDCFSCGKNITTVDICESHIDDHCQTLYPCPICKKVLPNKLEAAKHLTVHFKEPIPVDIKLTPTTTSDNSSIDILGGILCYCCDTLFKNRTEFDNHFTTEHEDHTIVYTCHICGKQYEKYLLFGNHCHFHISKDRFQCDQCDKTFPRLSLLVIHTDSFHTNNHNDKPYQCDTCGNSFMARYRLFEHLRSVHGEYSVKCPEQGCTAVFESPKDLILHQKQHMTLSDNWCRQCGLQFVSLSSCEKHLDMHKLKQYSCPVCNREYREKYLMVKHIPQHFQSTVHMCKVCGKVFNARHQFMKHQRTHSDQRAHKCTYCPKSFFKAYELQQHLNLHTGQRPYECAYCPKMFANYPNWSKHITRIHNVDKSEIKQLRLLAKASKNNETKIDKSPAKADSGIGSVSSEVSTDVYSFAESDDSLSRGPLSEWANDDSEPMVEMDTIYDSENNMIMSLSDTVNAVIERIDKMDDNEMVNETSEIDEINISDEFTSTFKALDETNYIKDIVDDIDAMSGEMESPVKYPEPVDMANQHTTDIKNILEFTEMMPVNNSLFDVNSLKNESATPVCPTEYGPDFVSTGTEMFTGELLNLNDHMLPHIDPLLTIKPENNLMTPSFTYHTEPLHYMQDNWEPYITKVYNFGEPNDKMYVMKSNIF